MWCFVVSVVLIVYVYVVGGSVWWKVVLNMVICGIWLNIFCVVWILVRFVGLCSGVSIVSLLICCFMLVLMSVGV